ncbi:MAG: hypothetical protein ABIJ14_01035 [Nanoarchaeota archaeon]
MKLKNKLLALLVISVIALAIAGFIVADTRQDLQNELAQLEQELIDSGFGWLVNYSGTVENVFYEIFSKFKYVNKYTNM